MEHPLRFFQMWKNSFPVSPCFLALIVKKHTEKLPAWVILSTGASASSAGLEGLQGLLPLLEFFQAHFTHHLSEFFSAAVNQNDSSERIASLASASCGSRFDPLEPDSLSFV